MFKAAWCSGRRWVVVRFSLVIVFGMMWPPSAFAQTTQPKKMPAEEISLVSRAIANEAKLLEELRKRSPVVEIYRQDCNGGVSGRSGLSFDSDTYGLYRVVFDRLMKGEETRQPKEVLAYLKMMFIDLKSFDLDSYKLKFVRHQALDGVGVSVFDVLPVTPAPKRFAGRIFVERRDGNVVRLTGGRGDDHFDSWRKNVLPGWWLPSRVYSEASNPDPSGHCLKFSMAMRIWGYQTGKPVAKKASGGADDVALERLYEAGLIDGYSDLDRRLSAIVNEMSEKNGMEIGGPIQVRVLLGDQLATMSFGRTILISRGLLDTTLMTSSIDSDRQRGIWRAALAFPLAQIVLGQRTDAEAALQDSLLYPERMAFERIPLHHTKAENQAAAKKAMDLLGVSDFRLGQDEFSLYLQEVELRATSLKALYAPLLGDGLLMQDGHTWMHALIAHGPTLDEASTTQLHAAPVGYGINVDPWSDEVTQTGLGSNAPNFNGRQFTVVPPLDILYYVTNPPVTPVK